MSSCNTFPTLTRTDEIVTGSLSTSTTTRVTTLPPTITTITLTPSCTATTPCSARPIVTTSEIPGGSTTVVETVLITVPVTSSQLTTLWGSSCTRTAQEETSVPPTPTETWTPPTSTFTPTFSTPPPSIIVTSSSSTQADGSVTPVVVTITSTASPVLVSQPPTSDTGSNNSDNSKNLGPIIGGVVGGVVGLAAILFLIWFIIRRRRRWDDIFDNDDDDVAAVAAAAQRREKQAEANPKPYQYGLVGHTKSASLTSPPSSPPPTTATAQSDGYEPTHQRHNSSTPLLGHPVSMITHGTGTSSSPRPPSSAGSAQGYGPLPQDFNAFIPGFVQTSAPPPQGQQIWDPNVLYNPVMQQQPQLAGASAGFASGAVIPNAAATMMDRRMSHDVEHRTGSPVSIQEQRILQVTNGGPDLGPQSPVNGPPNSTGAAVSTLERDGKGRLVMRGENAPMVHLDGGRLQEPVAGSSSAAAGPAPPAYSE